MARTIQTSYSRTDVESRNSSSQGQKKPEMNALPNGVLLACYLPLTRVTHDRAFSPPLQS